MDRSTTVTFLFVTNRNERSVTYYDCGSAQKHSPSSEVILIFDRRVLFGRTVNTKHDPCSFSLVFARFLLFSLVLFCFSRTGSCTGAPTTHITVCLLTVSDRASQGVYKDLSGPAMRKLLTDEARPGPLVPFHFASSSCSVNLDEIKSRSTKKSFCLCYVWVHH